MTNNLTIDIPSSVTARYVVAADESLQAPESFVTEVLTGHPLTADLSPQGAVTDLVGSPELRITSLPAGDSPWRADFTHLTVFDDNDHERLVTATRHLVVECKAPPERQPHAGQLARAAARGLAEATDGLLVDLRTSQVVPPDPRIRGERPWFCLADRWLHVDCLVNSEAGLDTPPTECSCLCLFTRGLARYGLPELVIDQVACAYDLAATNLMRGLAVQLLTRLWNPPGTRRLSIEEAPMVTAEDMWAYWAAKPLFGGRVPIGLADARPADLPGGHHLEILPHPDFRGTRAEWGTDVLSRGLSAVTGWQPGRPAGPHRPTGINELAGTRLGGRPPERNKPRYVALRAPPGILLTQRTTPVFYRQSRATTEPHRMITLTPEEDDLRRLAARWRVARHTAASTDVVTDLARTRRPRRDHRPRTRSRRSS